MTTLFPFPTSNDEDEQLNVQFSIVPHFKFILDAFSPTLGGIVEQPMYRTDIDFQFKAMKLCFYGFGYKFDASRPDLMTHLTELIEEIEGGNPYSFLVHLLELFDGGEYLQTRIWFCQSPLRQLKTLIILLTDFKKDFYVCTGDFDYQANCLLYKAYCRFTATHYSSSVFFDGFSSVIE